MNSVRQYMYLTTLVHAYVPHFSGTGIPLQHHAGFHQERRDRYSPVAEHTWEKQHHSSSEETAILAQERNIRTLLIKEDIMLTRQEKL